MEEEYIHSGLTFYMEENYKSAVEEFSKALENENSKDSLMYRGCCHIQLGNYENAIKDLTAALNLSQENQFDILYHRAKAFYLNQNFQEGQEDITTTLQLQNLTEEQKERINSLQKRFS